MIDMIDAQEPLKKKRVKKTRLIIKMKPATPKSLEVLNHKIHEVLQELIDDTDIEHNHNIAITEKVSESKVD